MLGWEFGDPAYVGNSPAVDYSITATGGQLFVNAGNEIGHVGAALKQHFFEDGADYELSFDIITADLVYVVAGNMNGAMLVDAVMSGGSYSFPFTGNGEMSVMLSMC